MNRVWRVTVLFVLLFCSVTLAHAASAFQEGDWGQEVAQIQTQLGTLGYNAGEADGDFGAATTAAVKAFQQDRGLAADGVIGAATYQAIMGRAIPISRGSSTATVRRLIQTAMRYVGVPYVFGGTSPDGFDCSGFVRFVFAGSGIDLPRMADQQYDSGRPVTISQLQPGDTVYFSTYTSGISHVGIYIGDGRFISATSSRGIAVDRLDDGYWRPRYLCASRML